MIRRRKARIERAMLGERDRVLWSRMTEMISRIRLLRRLWRRLEVPSRGVSSRERARLSSFRLLCLEMGLCWVTSRSLEPMRILRIRSFWRSCMRGLFPLRFRASIKRVLMLGLLIERIRIIRSLLSQWRCSRDRVFSWVVRPILLYNR